MGGELDLRLGTGCPFSPAAAEAVGSPNGLAEDDERPPSLAGLAAPPEGVGGLFGHAGGQKGLHGHDLSLHDRRRKFEPQRSVVFSRSILFRSFSGVSWNCRLPAVLFFRVRIGLLCVQVGLLLFGTGPGGLRDLDEPRLGGRGPPLSVPGGHPEPERLARQATSGLHQPSPRDGRSGAPSPGDAVPLVPFVLHAVQGILHGKPDRFGIAHIRRVGFQRNGQRDFPDDRDLPGRRSLEEHRPVNDLGGVEDDLRRLSLPGGRVEMKGVSVPGEFPVDGPLVFQGSSPLSREGGARKPEGCSGRGFGDIRFEEDPEFSSGSPGRQNLQRKGGRRDETVLRPCLHPDLHGPPLVARAVEGYGPFRRGGDPSPVHEPDVPFEPFASKTELLRLRRERNNFARPEGIHGAGQPQPRTGRIGCGEDGHRVNCPYPVGSGKIGEDMHFQDLLSRGRGSPPDAGRCVPLQDLPVTAGGELPAVPLRCELPVQDDRKTRFHPLAHGVRT